jgi:hypothetical protein
MTKTARRTRRDYAITPTGHGATRCTRVTFAQLFNEVRKLFPDANIVLEQDLLVSTIAVIDMNNGQTLATIEEDE